VIEKGRLVNTKSYKRDQIWINSLTWGNLCEHGVPKRTGV